MTQAHVWAASVLAFQAKPEGGTDYYHTVVLIEAVDQERAAAGAMQVLHQTCPEAGGWHMHQATVVSYGEPPAQLARAGDVYREVWEERRRQDGKYGGAVHDDEHTARDWVELLTDTARLADVDRMSKGELEYRRRMIQVAAVSIAAVESFDRGAKLTA